MKNPNAVMKTLSVAKAVGIHAIAKMKKLNVLMKNAIVFKKNNRTSRKNKLNLKINDLEDKYTVENILFFK